MSENAWGGLLLRTQAKRWTEIVPQVLAPFEAMIDVERLDVAVLLGTCTSEWTKA
ncbi:MAG: hypothetical protein SFW67_35940 [Myxococcaceae bacterium]|nr:hypothetical protein [Myxococcaceae bacterium]